MIIKSSFVLVPLCAAAACSGNPSSQVLTGRVAPGTPISGTTVRAMHGRTVLASTALAGDGSFTLAVPPSRNVTLQIVNTGRSDVVFPRHSGVVQRGFVIRAGGRPFDLGTLHLTQGAATHFAFHDGSSHEAECDRDCHDQAGATCVDDQDEHDDSCEAETETETDHHDGEPDDNGAEADAATDRPDEGDSVADHNFPANGCTGGGGGGGGSGSGSGGNGVP